MLTPLTATELELTIMQETAHTAVLLLVLLRKILRLLLRLTPRLHQLMSAAVLFLPAKSMFPGILPQAQPVTKFIAVPAQLVLPPLLSEPKAALPGLTPD